MGNRENPHQFHIWGWCVTQMGTFSTPHNFNNNYCSNDNPANAIMFDGSVQTVYGQNAPQ